MFHLLVMAVLLGASSFGCGMAALSFVFSKNHLTRLTTLGSGLLFGTALGVIVPEGLETLADASPTSHLSSSRVALPLLCGFTFMLIIEQLFASHSHPPTSGSIPMANTKTSLPSEVEFDAELGDIDGGQGTSRSASGYTQTTHTTTTVSEDSGELQAMPLTLGLIIHSLADGFALGVSFFPTSAEQKGSSLPVIVFLAIIVHKLPTSLALTSSLLTTSLSRSQCKKHLAAFSVSTPIAALLTYILLDFFGGSGHSDWPGIALLLSGGTFLNVATLVSHHSDSKATGEISDKTRVFFTVLGIFIPFTLSSFLGHGH